MAISAELLEILVCPACKGRLELTHEGGGLHCGHCRLAYPIQDSIPVMLVQEARPDSPPDTPPEPGANS